MTKVGILVHCRNLNTIAWEDLVFGVPAEGKLGDNATLARALLALAENEEVVSIIIGRGPSMRDGLDEGEYSKKFLIDTIDELEKFEVLKPLLAKLSDEERTSFRQLLESTVLTPPIGNTHEELIEAAKIFNEAGVDKVIEISAGSHAPRCQKEQNVLRSQGVIKNNQMWYLLATDMAYHDTKPEDVCVIEPLHRLDQPLTFVRPGLSEVIAPYFTFDDEERKVFIKAVHEFMTTRNHLS
jgi:hypothetical protein